MVAGVAAYASYEHQRHFALAWGAEQVSSALWPLSVDGLLVLASLRLLEVGPQTRRRVRYSVWTAFGLGVIVSLVANIAAAPTLSWRPVVVAGWPPIALLLAVELLAVGRQHAPTPAPEPHALEAMRVGDSGNGSSSQRKSVRDAVRHVLESSGSAMTNSEIMSTLTNSHPDTSHARLRRNVTNSLWSLCKAGLIATRDGRNVWTGSPATHDT
jgi:uncharacterized protein DUF2637